ncbi:hypothetical protein Cgig2_001110 [Carnegiea gigantea]|uniref:Uncharacterized protein n=1 Tax=Carnegiea gigantea TaxID=171969 RepID=A0A9Q1JWW8_9CARY|nr:hypothetical protein Cgig2_001110 [Carnegiea gigantea]
MVVMLTLFQPLDQLLILGHSHHQNSITHRSFDLINLGFFREPELPREPTARAFFATPCFLFAYQFVFFLSLCADSEHTLCPGFELSVAKQAAEHRELPKLPQVIFYTMLLNEAERLGVLQGRRLRSWEVAVTELHWSAFELWIWLLGDRIYEARFGRLGRE